MVRFDRETIQVYQFPWRICLMDELDKSLLKEALRLLDFAYHELECYTSGFTIFWEDAELLFNNKRFCELISEFNKKELPTL